eukprot:s1_g1679.t1
MFKVANISINARIFLSAFVPLVMLMVVGTFSATEHYVSYASLDRLQTLSEAAPKLSSIVHDLQRERGYSAGFIATKGGATWRANLDAQYAKTDETLEAALSDLRDFPAAEFGAEFAASLTQAMKLIEQLSDQRQRAQSLSVPVPVIAGYYTSTNRQLLDALSAIAALADDPSVKGNAIAYVNLLEGKERAGLERAMGAAGFGAGQFPPKIFEKFLMLLGAQDAFLANAKAYASGDIRAFYAETVAGPAVTKVETFRNAARDAGTGPLPAGYGGPQWFEAITEKIDLVYLVEARAAKQLVEGAALARGSALTSLLAIVIGVLVASVASAVLCWVFARSIVHPLDDLRGELGDIADGAYDITVSGTDQQGQIGDMARAVDVLRSNSEKAKKASEEKEKTEQLAAEERQQTINAMADQVEQSLTEMVTTLSSASTELSQTANNMSGLAEATNSESTKVTEASDHATQNVESVASASSQLSSAISEVTEQITIASKLTVESQTTSEETEEQMKTLAEAADRIGSVMSLIQEIAEQTNLLALNATIEAARAGDAGKGFAVVAAEVKDLANQTAKATEEISSHVMQVQQETANASNAMSTIHKQIGEINHVTAAVSAAVEEQSSATNEISRSSETTAEMNRSVSESIQKVRSVAQESGAAAKQVSSAADELSTTSEQLRTVVADLIRSIRAA